MKTNIKPPRECRSHMTRFIFSSMLVILFALLGSDRLIAVELIPPGSGTGLKAVYWANSDVTGQTVAASELTLDHRWSSSAIPAPGLKAGAFSATWSGLLQARSTELYTIATISDDGVQVALDGNVIINNWTNHGETRNSAQVALKAGQMYDLRVTYFNGGGLGSIRLLWSSPSIPEQVIPATQLYVPPVATLNSPGSGAGVRAVYWDTQNFSGSSVIVQESTIDHQWGTAAPIAGIAASTFSVCWTADLEALSTEKYAFTSVADDGIRVEIDGVVIIDAWSNAVGKRTTGYVDLVAGHRYKLRVTYNQGVGGAFAQLRWSTPNIQEQVIPTAQLYPTVPDINVGTGTGFSGAYFPTANFVGLPQIRLDNTLNFSWPDKVSPTGGIPVQNYSAHWRATFTAPFTSSYTFALSSDDGSILFVNGVKLCGKWGSIANSGTIYLKSGEPCELTILYYQLTGPADCHLTMSTPEIPPVAIPSRLLTPESLGAAVSGGNGVGLTGTYFSQEYCSGAKQTRVDTTVAFNLSSSVAPVQGMGKGAFSVVWNGFVEPKVSEPYTFFVMAPDSCSVWFNGALVVDVSGRGPAEIKSFNTAPLEVGRRYKIRIVHSNHTNSGLMELAWQSPATAFSVVPKSQLYPGMEEPSVPLLIDGAPMTGGQAGFDTAYPGILEAMPIDSWTNPAWIEGRRAAGSNPVMALMDQSLQEVCQGGESRWYIDGAAPGRPPGLTLVPGKENRLLISQADGTQNINRLVVPVRWAPINLFQLPYGLDKLTIRMGDSLLVSGTTTDGEAAEIDSQYVDSAFVPRMTAVGPGGIPLLFSAPGIYKIAARRNGIISSPFQVTVVDVDLKGPTACEAGYIRPKTIQVTPPGVVSEVALVTENDQQLALSPKATNVDGSIQFTIHPLVKYSTAYQVRLSQGGPVIRKQPVDVFVMKRTSDRTINRIAVYPDGTVLAQEDLNMFPLIEGLSVDLWIFKAGVTFDDSTIRRKLATNSDFERFEGYGRYSFNLLKPTYVRGGLCHAFTVFQNNVQVSY